MVKHVAIVFEIIGEQISFRADKQKLIWSGRIQRSHLQRIYLFICVQKSDLIGHLGLIMRKICRNS